MNKPTPKKKETKLSQSRVVRWIFLIIGFVSLGLGTVGFILPILPTVPFYLLSSFCFVKGSKRSADCFLNSKLYKKYVGNFAEHRVMTAYGEIILLLSVTAMLLVSLWFINKPVMSIVFVVLILCKYAYFVFRITPVGKKEYLTIRKRSIQKKEEEKAC